MTITCVTLTYNNAEATTRLLGSLDRPDRPRTSRSSSSTTAPTSTTGSSSTAFMAAMTCPSRSSSARRTSGSRAGTTSGSAPALAAGAEWVVLLNNDTEVDPDFIEQLRAHPRRRGRHRRPARSRRRASSCGPGGGAGSRSPSITTRRRTARPTPTSSVAPWRSTATSSSASASSTTRTSSTSKTSTTRPAPRAPGSRCTSRPSPSLRHGVSESTAKLGAPLLARYHARNAIRFNATQRTVVGPHRCWCRGSRLVAARELAKVVIGRDRRARRAVLAGHRSTRSRERWGIDRPARHDRHRVRVARGSDLGRRPARREADRGARRPRARAAPVPHHACTRTVRSRNRSRYDDRLFAPRPVGLPALLGHSARSSFSLYYFLLLPLALRRDRPARDLLPELHAPDRRAPRLVGAAHRRRLPRSRGPGALVPAPHALPHLLARAGRRRTRRAS